jgi:hypothetical protein
MTLEEFNKYNNLVFFIDRGNVEYKTEGRLESLSEAQAIDSHYIDICKEYHIPFEVIENKKAVETIVNRLKELGYVTA